MKLDPIPFTKINLKSIKDFNVRPKSGRKHRQRLLHTSLGNDFFGQGTKNTRQQKQKQASRTTSN
jgi:hypothetical protein